MARSASVRVRGKVLALEDSSKHRMRRSIDVMPTSRMFGVIDYDRKSAAVSENPSNHGVIKGRATNLQRLDVRVQFLVGHRLEVGFGPCCL
jgi:hypothetical protein